MLLTGKYGHEPIVGNLRGRSIAQAKLNVKFYRKTHNWNEVTITSEERTELVEVRPADLILRQ